MTTVSLFDAKTHLSRLVEDLASGKEEVVIISRRGKPVARLEPVRVAAASRRIGRARGRFKIPANIDRINKQVAALFTGEPTPK